MDFVWAGLAVLGVICLSALLLGAVALFSPFIFSFDSASGQVRVRWLAVLEYRRPLARGQGKASFSIAGKSIKVPARPRKRRRERTAPGRARRKKRAAFVQFLRNCLREPMLRRIMVVRLKQLGKGIFRAIDLKRWHADLSLPDPAWNGMLAGWFGYRYGGPKPAVGVNFTGENGLFLEFRVYPYRVARVLLLFSAGLPYRALWHEWRAASAMVSR